MANVQVVKTGDIDMWVQNLTNKIRKVADDAVSSTAAESSTLMKQYIASRGTNRQWSRFYTGRSGTPRDHSGTGRIDSGQMLNAVGHQEIVDTRDRFIGEFGWINGDTNGYFVLQEKGFYNQLAGVWIEPMNALRDSFTNATITVREKISAGMRTI